MVVLVVEREGKGLIILTINFKQRKGENYLPTYPVGYDQLPSLYLSD